MPDRAPGEQVKRLIVFGAAAAALLLAGAAPAVEYIARDEWPAIQRGIQVTQYGKLAGIVNEHDRTPGSNIVVLYPGGEAGERWAEQIRDWLVALGIPSREIALRPGSGEPESLALQVEKQGFK